MKHTWKAALAASVVAVASYDASSASFYDSGQATLTPTSTTIEPHSLEAAFIRNAPPGWSLQAPSSLKRMNVRWPQHTGQWLTGLDAVGRQYGIVFDVNTHKKEVQARARSASHTPAPGKPRHSVTKWRIVKGKSLRDNLEAWAKKAGWSLIWSAYVDYPILASATMKGPSFEEAVKELAEALKHTRAPLNFKVSSNKVLRVSGGTEWGK